MILLCLNLAGDDSANEIAPLKTRHLGVLTYMSLGRLSDSNRSNVL